MDFIAFNFYIYPPDWFVLMSVNLVSNDIWAAYINIIREGVDLFVPSFIDSTMLCQTLRLQIRLNPTLIIYARQ